MASACSTFKSVGYKNGNPWSPYLPLFLASSSLYFKVRANDAWSITGVSINLSDYSVVRASMNDSLISEKLA